MQHGAVLLVLLLAGLWGASMAFTMHSSAFGVHRALSHLKPRLARAATVVRMQQRLMSHALQGIQGDVILHKGKARLFEDGNPLVYNGAINETVAHSSGHLKAGDLVAVKDCKGHMIGCGFYNPESMFRVRLLTSSHQHQEQENLTVQDIITSRIKQAKLARDALNLPNQETNCFRLVNGEGDGLSGLVVDVFSDYVVAQASAYWVQDNQELIIDSLQSCFPDLDVLWRTNADRLSQDGWTRHVPLEYPEDAEDVAVKEGGISYLVHPTQGQKTGFFCDQRDNRAILRTLAKDKDVLDLYCYTGGFALSAKRGGARSVIGVDSSELAIQTAKHNARLNNADVAFQEDDAERYLKKAFDEGRSYDIMVLDPPKLAPTRTSLSRAARKYEQINALAMRVVRPNGLLMTFSCSAAVTQEQKLVQFVQAAARKTDKQLTIMKQLSAAACHTANPGYPEGNYLSGLLLNIR